MFFHKIRDRLLLTTIGIGLLTAVGSMSAVSWVIRQQHLDQSSVALHKALTVISDELARRQAQQLAAADQLATQGRLPSTLWYLSQYADSDLDRETLLSTYLQLVREARSIGRTANSSKIALYDSTGRLMAFSQQAGDGKQQAGFVTSKPATQFHLAVLGQDQELESGALRQLASLSGMPAVLAGPLPPAGMARYVVSDGKPAIETLMPVLDHGPDGGDATSLKRVGVVRLVQELGPDFVGQMARLTDTEVNVFVASELSSGTLAAYVHAGAAKGSQAATSAPLAGGVPISDLVVGGKAYYEGHVALATGQHEIGSIAVLQSKAHVESSIRQANQVLALIALACLALVVPVAWVLANSISRPVSRLSRIFRHVAAAGGVPPSDEELSRLGDDTAVRGGELGDLARSFLAMNAAVQQKIQQIHGMNTSLERVVTERTAALSLREQESRTLIENSPDQIVRYDAACRRTYVNPAMARVAGRRAEDMVGLRPTDDPGDGRSFDPNAELYEARIREVLASGRSLQFERRWEGEQGRTHCSHVTLTPETDAAGRVVSVLGIGRDISERLAYEAAIWRQANFDSLTELPNRRMFNDRLDMAAKAAQRSGQAMVLMLIDLDHFKEVNDTLGHEHGDQLLREAARRVVGCVRDTDTVARLGGDEFAVILSSIESPEAVDRIAQTLIDHLSEAYLVGGERAYVSASIGITRFPDDARDLGVLLKYADQAMYGAKTAGRNRFNHFTSDLQESALRRSRLSGDLRLALEQQQFEIHYQPIVDLATGAVRKAEALLRWNHPVHGLISPTEFIPLAEETGLIVAISDWVFRQAVEQTRQWSQQHEALQISINLSPFLLRHSDKLLGSWLDHLRERGFDGRQIVLEITEGTLLHAERRVINSLLALRDAGIQVAIDDFGTGYSSLAYLKRFDIDYLKIDRAFVHNLGEDADNRALCEAIIVMAHKLSLQVIAEGVETAGQRDFLANSNCDFAQGFLYARPQPAADFARWVWG